MKKWIGGTRRGHTRTWLYWFVAVGMTALVCIACGGGGGSSSGSSTNQPVQNPTVSPTLGSWSGDNVSFTLRQGSLLVDNLSVICSGTMIGSKCSGDYTMTFTNGASIPVTNNTFVWEVPELKLTGTFTSESTVKVDVSWASYNSSCDGWARGSAAYYAAPGAPIAKAIFKGLGSLPGSSGPSYPYAISRNGNVITGTALSSTSNNYNAFRYSEIEKMKDLGILPGDTYSAGYGLSFDGSVVVGTSFNSSNQREAFRWSASGGMIGLGFLPGYTESIALAASGDGSVVVGHCEPWFEAFHWSQSAGMVSLGVGYPNYISTDGTVVVGGGFVLTGPGTTAYLQAVQWIQQNDPVGLGYLPGDDRSEAWAISDDKLVVVGWSGLATGQSQAFRWTQQIGMVGLGRLNPQDTDSTALGVSQNGSVVVGKSFSDTSSEAFIWRIGQGLQSLKEVLTTEYKLDLTGWQLLSAYGISDDGKVITGTGVNPSGNDEGWIVSFR
jgi:probable HAF family extracellular repeat protein